MSDTREIKTLIVTTILGLGILGGIFAVFNYSTTVQAWLKSEDESGIIVSRSAMRELLQSVKDDYEEQWREEYAKLKQAADEMAAMKARELDRLAPEGDENRTTFEQLCATKHKTPQEGAEGDAHGELTDIYQKAVALEMQLMNDYHDILAVKNAVDRHREALDAINQVKMVHPTRISLKRPALEADIETPGEKWERFKAELKTGKTEVLTIVKHAETVLKKAREGDKKKGLDGVTVISHVGGGSVAGKTLAPDQLNVDSGGTTDGPFKAVPGHILHKDGFASRNLYLRDWYIMGPFDNRFRINRDAAFLPETVVDLDSKTVGKGGEVIGWKYTRCRRQRIEPTTAMVDNGVVYYGYTEVWIDPDAWATLENGEIWCALGSDDKGKMWLNGKPVWESGNERKAYRADEWVGALQFEPGKNEILFRCENDGGTMGWSVVLVVSEF